MTDEPLLHTPTSSDKDGKARYDHRASPGYVRKKPVPNLMAQIEERTSASSQGSEDLTSPSSGSGSDASDRSSTSQPVQTSWLDGGPTSPDGEMSTGSPLLPTPTRESERTWPEDKPPTLGQWMTRHLASSSAATPASRSATPAAGAAPTTPATSGPSSPVLLASFDPDTPCWRTFQATLASELPTYSQTLPRSGMTRHGRLFALPMWERRTAGNGGSALLPTAKTPTGGSEAREAREARGSGGEDLEARLRSLGEPTPPPSNDGSE